MGDLIDMQAALKEVREAYENDEMFDGYEYRLEELPDAIARGEWLEREVYEKGQLEDIEEWQSAKCSVCGRYHTTPYMYYFSDYNFCPNCGADMRGGERMTREEAIKKHRELWHWIANETRRRKTLYVRKDENPDVANEMPSNDCWLCEYVRSIGSGCEDCPINWGSMTCFRPTSPYRAWTFCHSLDYEERANLADIIAELPEKGEK